MAPNLQLPTVFQWKEGQSGQKITKESRTATSHGRLHTPRYGEEMCSGRKRSGWWVGLAKVSNIIRSWGRRGQMFQSGESLRPAVTMEGLNPKSRTNLRCLAAGEKSVKPD